jgi:hypothetical protein
MFVVFVVLFVACVPPFILSSEVHTQSMAVDNADKNSAKPIVIVVAHTYIHSF